MSDRYFELPTVPAPSLEGLSAQVMAPVPPGPDELIERLHQRLRGWAPRRQRRSDEPICEGDEVRCDVITTVDGHAVPGGCSRWSQLEMRPFVQLPGLLEEMLGMTAGARKTFDLVLPPGYPIPELSGKTAHIQVFVHEIYEVQTPELDDLAAIRGSGLGDSVEDAMDAVAAEIDAEQGAQLLADASEAVLWELSDRVQGEVPEDAIDEELLRAWEEQQGELFDDMEMTEDVRDEARASYIGSPELREEARRRLKIGMGLAALVEAEGLTPSAEIMQVLIDNAAEAVGQSSEAVKKSLAAEPDRARQAAETALHLTAVEFVMARAKVDVIDP